MHAEYKRDVSHNYLILHGEEMINTASYQVRILTGNTMASILKCRMQGLDGKWLFYYDITSKQSVASFYEQRKLSGEDLGMILGGFLRVMEELAEFLLNAEQLVLSPEYMFLDIEKKEVYFCCLPDYHHPVQEQFRELTEYFLPKLDHEDPEAVNLGYGVYRKAMEPGFQLEHIKELLYRAGSGNKGSDVENNTGNETKSGKYDDTGDEWQGVKAEPELWTDEQEASGESEAPREKAAVRWKLAAGCAAGVMILLGILLASYLGYLPEIPVEAVLAAAIILMGAGAGCTWAAEKKKKKQEQSAEWRNKVQRELAVDEYKKCGKEKTAKDEAERKKTENQRIQEDNEIRNTVQRNQEQYGETVVLSAGQLSGPASLVSREPGELATIYLERELTVIGKLEQAADAVIELPTVSRVHARIRKTGEDYYLADLNSRNGTSVNGRLLAAGEEYLLKDEDEVDFAQARYVFLKQI